jgi:hypothetical protein
MKTHGPVLSASGHFLEDLYVVRVLISRMDLLTRHQRHVKSSLPRYNKKQQRNNALLLDSSSNHKYEASSTRWISVTSTNCRSGKHLRLGDTGRGLRDE